MTLNKEVTHPKEKVKLDISKKKKKNELISRVPNPSSTESK
jgi:hypothetical protein